MFPAVVERVGFGRSTTLDLSDHPDQVKHSSRKLAGFATDPTLTFPTTPATESDLEYGWKSLEPYLNPTSVEWVRGLAITR